MANDSSPLDDYDVLIDNDLNISDTEQCTQYDPRTLSTSLVPQVYIAVFLVGLLGNLLVLLVLVKYQRLRRMENIYFLNLAICNLCFLLALLFWAHSVSHGELLGDPLCKVPGVLSSVGLHGEALFNILLTVQRYLVFFHMRGISPAASKVPCGVSTSVLAWVTATLVTWPEFLPSPPQRGLHSQGSGCASSKLHFLPGDELPWEALLPLKLSLVGLLVALLALLVCYVRMRQTLRSREHDLFKLVLAIVAVFLLMWGPYGLALFLSTFKGPFSLQDCRSSYHLDRSVHTTQIIASTHCCVNPLLHVLLHRAFRRRLCHLLRLCDDTPLGPTEDSAQDTAWEEQDGSTAV